MVEKAECIAPVKRLAGKIVSNVTYNVSSGIIRGRRVFRGGDMISGSDKFYQRNQINFYHVVYCLLFSTLAIAELFLLNLS